MIRERITSKLIFCKILLLTQCSFSYTTKDTLKVILRPGWKRYDILTICDINHKSKSRDLTELDKGNDEPLASST